LLPLVFLLYPGRARDGERVTLVDWGLAALAALPPLYGIVNADAIGNRLEGVDRLSGVEMALGVLIVLLVIEAVRRSVSGVMALLIGIFLLYMPLGPYLPGILGHRGISFERILESAYLAPDGATFGSLIGISATYIGLFVIFGAALS